MKWKVNKKNRKRNLKTDPSDKALHGCYRRTWSCICMSLDLDFSFLLAHNSRISFFGFVVDPRVEKSILDFPDDFFTENPKLNKK